MHIPVLNMEGEKTVMNVLRPQPHETVLDLTLGLAGHAKTFLACTAPTGRLIGLDADPENLALARTALGSFGDRVILIHGNFRDAQSLVSEPVDILFADLGVSSPHFDDPSRGFTFRHDAPLDLRYDRSSGKTAAELILDTDEKELGRVFAQYGELAGSFRFAKAVVSRVSHGSVKTTTELKAVVDEVFGYKAPQVLPQIFQALRIWTNDEMGALESLLSAIGKLLRPGGRAGIISYHSLEDRLVKQCFRALTTAPRDEVTGRDLEAAPFELLTRKAIVPSDREIAENPRARSARFRAIRRRL